MTFNASLQLNAIVIQLMATNDGRVPATQGALAHAAFLDLVAAVDARLATHLHDSGTRNPFTLSPLRGLPGQPEEGFFHVRAGNRTMLRLTLLDPTLFLALMQRLLNGPGLSLRLGDVMFAVEQTLGSPGSHPWAGWSTAGELRARASREPRIRMVFASPTAINLGERAPARQRMILIPSPQHIFASLRSTWNQLTGDEIPYVFESWVADYVFVREVRNWRTAVYQLKRGTYPGGYGDVVFEALDPAAPNVSILNLLADFAFYSGVGTKTAMGMGQAKRVG